MNQWTIYFDPKQKRPRDAHTKCPHCGALDKIVEVDRAIRFNELSLSSNGATATAIIGDEGDWEFAHWFCTACASSDLASPNGFEILEWE